MAIQKVFIDHVGHSVSPGLTQGKDLLSLAGNVTENQQLLLDLNGEIDIPIAPDDWIVIRGNERFVIGNGRHPIDDNPCLRQPLQIKLNGKLISSEQAFRHPKVTAEDIRSLDPNINQSDNVIADLQGLADEALQPGWRLILQRSDEFITVPCGNVGLQSLVEHHLLDLQKVYPAARFERTDSSQYVVIPDFQLPSHWPHETTTLLLMLPNGYPTAAMDMFWVTPFIKLKDGQFPQGAETIESHLGREWQRFSWHYTNPADWQACRSNLLTHVQFSVMRLVQAK